VVFALNPMLLTMSASVQNDTLALALGLAALELAIARLSSRPSAGITVLVGAVAGLAILTKLTAWVLVPGVAGWLVCRHRRESVQAVATFIAAATAACGWWFVRNIILYGDLTGARAVSRTGVDFSRYHLHSPTDLGHVVQEAITYLWLPTEYLRNTISAGPAVKGAVVLLTAAIAVAGLTRRPAKFVPLVGVCALLSVAAWLATYFSYEAVAPRVAYMALPLWVALIAAGLSRLPRRSVLVAPLVVVAALNVWTIEKIRSVPNPPSPITTSTNDLRLAFSRTACSTPVSTKSKSEERRRQQLRQPLNREAVVVHRRQLLEVSSRRRRAALAIRAVPPSELPAYAATDAVKAIVHHRQRRLTRLQRLRADAPRGTRDPNEDRAPSGCLHPTRSSRS
jgi:hypothetical protein